MIMKRVIYILSALFLCLSCMEEDDRIEAVEIGAMEDTVTLECTEGTYVMKVLANGDYTATVTQGSWLSFGDGASRYSGSSDQEVTMVYEMNRGTSRTAVVELSREGRTAQVVFVQKGVIDMGLSLAGHNVNMSAEGGLGSVRVETLMKNDELLYEVEYDGPQGWISGISKENNIIIFTALQNSLAEDRKAVIRISSMEDSSVADELHVMQNGAGASFETISFPQLHALASEEDRVVIGRNLVLEGRVINDNSEGNGSETLNISAELQDRQRADRVIYVQNSDASAGVLVEFKTVQDNTSGRFDRIRLNLNGMTLTKHPATAEEPLRYSLSGAELPNILETTGGSLYDLPVKERKIAQLTDADVYTYVTLTDCEIPVRKGPFVPVDLRYDDCMNKYPMPLRDKAGYSTFIMSNTSCAWARDGKGMPQGAGKVSGVVVHEKCDNFEWDSEAASIKMAGGLALDYVTGIGTISRYQIRPVTKAEIALAEDFADSFSGMLMEIRYVNQKNSELIVNADQSWNVYSTWPGSPYPLNDPAVTGVMRRFRKDVQEGLALWRDWTHLGPLDGNRITDPSGGNGVTDYNGASAHWSVYAQVSSSGLIIDANGSAWYCTKWNDDQWIRAEFSTTDLVPANFPLSVTFGAGNGLGESVGAPRYWTLEYSVDGTSWTKFAEYTVPDFPIVYKKRSWQCPGFKMMTFNLPDDSALLGKAKVYVRMKPANQSAGTADTYDTGAVTAGSQSALNYFAVRYNKL